MNDINNNTLKAELLNFVCATANLSSYTEQAGNIDLSKCDFSITVITNINVAHKLIFDYHCNLLSYSVSGVTGNLTAPAFKIIANILQKAKDISLKV
jgi:hypothetical protein